MSNRLLLVDDEPNVIQALMRVLRARLPRDVRLEGFTDPRTALMRAREVAFDVILSDFRMPQMDGITFLSKVRESQPHAIRMILSASTESQHVMNAVNHVEVFRYLSKPWVEDELVQHIQGALQRAEASRQERSLADDMRVHKGTLSAQHAEIKRLEELEPGITNVDWGPGGEVLMPGLDED